ncbi:hypothetical protein OIV83_004588 [Microbotryomycetes sp. JL201]|nr:hypothetical protein OIV83_004588 [Microbotryomycetes sp. JL201]
MSSAWAPPTPRSLLVSTFSGKGAHDDDVSFEPLPPALESIVKDESGYRSTGESNPSLYNDGCRGSSLGSLLNSSARDVDCRATPSSVRPLAHDNVPAAVKGYFSSSKETLELSQDSAPPSSRHGGDAHAMTDQQESAADPDSDWYENEKARGKGSPYKASVKRPLREAAATAQRSIPRQTSSLELSPPPARPGTQHSSRRVSHSLIERRRREKINECLAHLKRLVPQCRAEGERKIARARERGRKRRRKSDEDLDDSPRGGLHKLEILQGTILYVEELEARLAALGEHPSADGRRIQTERQNDSTRRRTRGSPNGLADARHTEKEVTSASARKSADDCDTSRTFTDDQATAELLLNLSTSPELRPVNVEDSNTNLLSVKAVL